MIHRRKDFNNPPPALIDQKWNSIRSDLLAARQNHKVRKSCYRDATIQDLIKIYEGKCALCERRRGTELQVDHYRPYKALADGAPVQRHPGYYWLAYEWSNLTLLCSKCNRSKSNKFPLDYNNGANRVDIDKHIIPPDQIPATLFDVFWLNANESPLIVNLEVDGSPERHFRYLPDGRVEGKTSEGRETISTCDLNRQDLILERMTILQDIVNSINEALDDYLRNDSGMSQPERDASLKGELTGVFRGILRGTKSHRPFALLYIHICLNFSEFIANKLENEYANKVRTYFGDFLRYSGGRI